MSSIFLDIENKGSLLLDCGEGTYGQLFRKFGKEKTEKILKKDLTAILITHMHADHHLGLVKFLKKRAEFTTEALVVIGPLKLKHWLSEVSLFDNLPNYKFVKSEKMPNDYTTQRIARVLGVNRIFPIKVSHSTKAFAYVVEHPNWKFVLVYSFLLYSYI